jgi:hypothetical protein
MNNQNLKPIKKGDARGGKREGAGRKPDAFKARCDECVDSSDWWEWVKSVFKGEDVEPHTTKEGVVFTPAGVSSRTYLWEKLAGYAKGKPVSMLELKDEDGKPVRMMGVVILPSDDSGKAGEVK